MRKIIGNKIVFDDLVKCDKCGVVGAYDFTSTFLCANCAPKVSENQKPFASSEVASGAQPQSGSASANGCRDARASSNHEADSSVIVETKAEPAGFQASAAVRRFRLIGGFKDGTRYLESNKSGMWLVTRTGRKEYAHAYSLNYCESKCRDGEWEEEPQGEQWYEPAGAAPRGQRASLDNNH